MFYAFFSALVLIAIFGFVEIDYLKTNYRGKMLLGLLCSYIIFLLFYLELV